MSSAQWQPFCFALEVLTTWSIKLDYLEHNVLFAVCNLRAICHKSASVLWAVMRDDVAGARYARARDPTARVKVQWDTLYSKIKP